MDKKEANDDGYRMLSDAGYSDKAIEYFQAKENMGVIEDADQITDLVGPCGDTMKISFNMDGDTINDAKIQVLGCPGAVASGCAVVNLTRGKTLDEAARIDMDVFNKEVGKLPNKKIHCARLAIKTLQKALKEYEEKSQGKATGESAGRK